MAVVCGIDDAGRGPILGPLVMAGVIIDEKGEAKLKKIGVKDSKLFKPKEREELFKKIVKIVKGYQIIVIPPKDIDNAVNGNDGMNLNWLEANASIKIIKKLNPEIVIVDSPSNNLKAYKSYFEERVSKHVKIIAEHKADLNYVVVGAASILAKVTRDKEIKKIKERIKQPIGSGYLHDPITIKFFESNYDKYPEIFRKSWQPYKDISHKKFQKTLDSFEGFVGKKKNLPIIEKLKKLEDFGYQFVDVKSPYESIRMKGKCTVVLYKSGKLVVQGKDEDKKVMQNLLK